MVLMTYKANGDVTPRLSVHAFRKETTDEEKNVPGGGDTTATDYKTTKRTFLLSLSLKVVKVVEGICGFWGLTVARHPLLSALGSIFIVTLFGGGLVRLNLVFRPYSLWVPENSEFYEVTEWMTENFPSTYRKQIAIWEGENILTPSVIKSMLNLHLEVERTIVEFRNRTLKYKDLCIQIPIKHHASIHPISLYSKEGQTSQFSADNYECYEASLLKLWNYNESIIGKLTDEEIIETLNDVNDFEVENPTNYSIFLGGTTMDERGNIIRATTALQTWITRIDKVAIADGDYEEDVATGEKVDLAGIAWERALVDVVKNFEVDDICINLHAGHTLGYVLHRSITQDAVWIGVGWSVLLIYVLLTLGKPFHPDQRVIPALVGLMSIGMAVLASYGACSMFGVPYGTLNNVLPVLLVALGVDDMYVIVTAWDGIDNSDADTLERKAQLTMKQAGMAITVTSITDILAFLVGTTTNLPGLQWFCIYSAMGISMVYFLQGTLFVSAMVVNERWVTMKEKKGKYTPINSRLLEIIHKFNVEKSMKFWSKFLLLPVTKISVLILTLIMLMFSMFNITQISREFDTMWLVPESTGLHKWYRTIEKSFPHESDKGVVFFKGVQLPEDLQELKNLSIKLNNLPEIIKVDAWYNEIDLEDLLNKYAWLRNMSPIEQCKLLISNIGIKNARHFHIDFDANSDGEEDEEETYKEHPCSTFKIEFQYIPPSTFESKQTSMAKVREIVRNAKVRGYKAAWAHVYALWETDRIILTDLFRSLSIVLAAVGFITLLLLASVRASSFVLLCVILTLVNVASTVHLWGLTVNTVTGIAFVLAVGICVDYAAHIAHDFLIMQGSNDERVASALHHMGSAVLHGGCSTLITFILLSPSDSYICVSYFKILTCVSAFGIYHALVFLPVLLSLCGPDSYPVESQTHTLHPVSRSAQEQINSILQNTPSLYTVDRPHSVIFSRFNPPPYSTHPLCPPLYRKSNSLPCLVGILPIKAAQDSSLPNNSSPERSFRHSTCCTKL